MAWRAQIFLSYGEGMHHVYANVDGDSQNDALAGARYIYDAFPKEKMRWVRALPVANSEVDFDSKKPIHSGFVRFSYNDQDGPTKIVDGMTSFPLSAV
jgi:hypothetical protein